MLKSALLLDYSFVDVPEFVKANVGWFGQHSMHDSMDIQFYELQFSQSESDFTLYTEFQVSLTIFRIGQMPYSDTGRKLISVQYSYLLSILLF